MKWRGARKSSNVEESSSGSSSGGLGNIFGGMTTTGKVSTGGGIGMIILIAIMFLTGGGDLGSLTNVLNDTPEPASYQTENVETKEYKDQKEFSSVVFAYLEDYWNEYFDKAGKDYTNPKLVLYNGSVRTACGQGQAQMGPFYCPGDQKVYLDLSFAKELSITYGAKGDFAMAYVIAHEVGHHVQNELGISGRVDRLRRQVSERVYNQYSVSLELQADYLAGTFAKYLDGEKLNGQPILDVGDIKEAIEAANAVGDDTLQQKYQGRVVPDSFTHGSSADRIKWFKLGYKYGDLKHGDTFAARGLDL